MKEKFLTGKKFSLKRVSLVSSTRSPQEEEGGNAAGIMLQSVIQFLLPTDSMYTYVLCVLDVI
jgi:hypothetical protein